MKKIASFLTKKANSLNPSLIHASVLCNRANQWLTENKFSSVSAVRLERKILTLEIRDFKEIARLKKSTRDLQSHLGNSHITKVFYTHIDS